MRRIRWAAVLLQTGLLAGFVLVAGVALSQEKDAGSVDKEAPAKEAPSALQPEQPRRGEATVIIPRRGGGFGLQGEPILDFEMRNEQFAAKLKLTDEQKARLNEIAKERADRFRAVARGGGTPDEMAKRRAELQTLSKAIGDKELEVLTPEQKAIWEARKQEVIAAGPRPLPRPETTDSVRIRALEVEVELLKAEIAKLKAAIEAKPATKDP